MASNVAARASDATGTAKEAGFFHTTAPRPRAEEAVVWMPEN